MLVGWQKSEKAQAETEKRLFVAPLGLYVELFWQLRRQLYSAPSKQRSKGTRSHLIYKNKDTNIIQKYTIIKPTDGEKQNIILISG